jgi:prophage regulatory protein
VVARTKNRISKPGNTVCKTEYFIMVENSSKPKIAQRMLTEAGVLELVPFGRTTLWRKEKDGSFPASTYISANRHAWFESEVADWQESIKGTGRSQQMKPKKDKAKPPKGGSEPTKP